MDRMITAFVAGKERPLHFSVDVLFAVNDKYGGADEALGIISQDTKESFECLRTLIVLMANDAELCRREEGYDHGEMLDVNQLSLRMRPAEYLALKIAVSQAVEIGFSQEQAKEDEDTDLGLLELRKKEVAGA